MRKWSKHVLEGIRDYKGFWRIDHFFCTAFVFGFMYLIYTIPARTGTLLNPVVDAIKDFELTDIIFSQDLRDVSLVDTNIVIVNIGDFDKYFLAEKIKQLAAKSPRLIALDLPLTKTDDPDADEALVEALLEIDNLVLSINIDSFSNKRSSYTQQIDNYQKLITKKSILGFNNFTDQKSSTTVRKFLTSIKLNGQHLPHFAIAAASLANPQRTREFLSRGYAEEYINYTGKLHSFFALDIHKLFSQTNEGADFFGDESEDIVFKDKIILMGYCGSSISAGENMTVQKYFTPMNEKYAGKSYPDMFQIVIHANILTMVLNNTPINTMPSWVSILLGVIVCFLNVSLFYYIHDTLPDWYDLYAKFIQLIETILLLFLVITLFQYTNFKLDLVLAVNAVVLSADLLEIYTGSVPNIVRIILKKFNLQSNSITSP
jgi:CHASE2 domain-containing sensor protein